MPTAGRPRTSALDHITRQQLDELDALMQRMLALPVNPPEDLPQPPTAELRGVAPPESVNDRPESQPEAATETACPLQADPTPAEMVCAPASEVALAPQVLGALTQPRLPNQGTDAPRSPLTQGRARQQGANAPRSPLEATANAKAKPPRLAWPLRPFLWANVAFDHGTAWFGPAGRWLRAPGGRALLGWTGLVLLVAALAWLVLDETGWTW